MSRVISEDFLTAMVERVIRPRDFVWFEVRRRDNGQTYSEGFWSGSVTISAQVIDPLTGSNSLRSFSPAYGMVSGSDIPLVRNLTIQRIELKFSSLNERIESLIRQYEPKRGKIYVWRGFLGQNGLLTSPAESRFIGEIDEVEFVRSAVGEEESYFSVNAVSDSRQLKRKNATYRNNSDHDQRYSGDNFYRDTSNAGNLEIFWGQVSKLDED